MGKRLKITGWFDTDDLLPEWIDLDHETGLTELGYDKIYLSFGGMDDVEIELVDEELT